MKKLTISLVLILTLVSCMSLGERLSRTESKQGVETAFWQAVAKFDQEPSNPEYAAFVQYYGDRAINSLLARADILLRENEFDRLFSTLYFGRNSAVAIIDAFTKRGFSHQLAGKPNQMRDEIDRALSEYYQKSVDLFNKGEFKSAAIAFQKIRSFGDSENYLNQSYSELKYSHALELISSLNYLSAYNLLCELPESFRDVKSKKEDCIRLGRVVIGFEAFDGFATEELYHSIIKDLQSEKFISVVELSNFRKYTDISLDWLKSHKINFILSVNAVFNLDKPSLRDFEGSQSVWAVSNDANVLNVKKTNNQLCTTYTFRSKPVQYLIRESKLKTSLLLTYKIIQVDNFATVAADVYRSENYDKTENYLLDPKIRLESLCLRNTNYDTLLSCSSRNRLKYEFSQADIEFQNKFIRRNDHLPDSEIMKRLMDEHFSSIKRDISKSIKSFVK